jgi:hypothetical protein
MSFEYSPASLQRVGADAGRANAVGTDADVNRFNLTRRSIPTSSLPNLLIINLPRESHRLRSSGDGIRACEHHRSGLQ